MHVWRANLDLPAAVIHQLSQSLSAEEHARATRFRAPRDRDRFLAARGVRRAILARYLHQPPERLTFRANLYGKPALAPPSGGGDLRFNVSHARNLALYAVTSGREVGVDIEYLQEEFDWEAIATRFFAPREVAALRSLPGDARREAFFTYWTSKEAYVKARGTGLSLAFDQFAVALRPTAQSHPRWAGDVLHDTPPWSLRILSPGDGYVAALAAEGDDWQLHCWQW